MMTKKSDYDKNVEGFFILEKGYNKLKNKMKRSFINEARQKKKRKNV